MNEFFIYSEDFTLSPGHLKGWRIFNVTDQKSFQELVFKAVKNRKRSGYVDCQQVRSIELNLFFSKLKHSF